jgi:hypothetical protein
MTNLERALSRFRHRPSTDGDVSSRVSAAAFRAMISERLRSVERDIADVKVRVNGLIFVVLAAVITQLLMKVAG